MNKTRPEDEMPQAALEALLAEAHEAAPKPSAAFAARLAADALAAQPKAAPAPRTPPRAAWRSWLDEIGGLPALGGLAMSACIGAYLGFANPQLTAPVQALAGLDAALDADDPFSMPLLGDLDWIDEG